MKRDPYDVLGVQRDTTLREIRSTYRQLAKVAHPDAGGDPREFIRLRDALDEIEEDRREHPLRRRPAPIEPWEREPERAPIAPRGPVERTPHSPRMHDYDDRDTTIDSTCAADDLPDYVMKDGTRVPGHLRRPLSGPSVDAFYNSKTEGDVIYDAYFHGHDIDDGWTTG